MSIERVNTSTFLERVSIAAREPVYSAAIAWLLDEQSPLPLEQRLAIVASISGIETKGGREIVVETEWKDVDLLLRIERETEPLWVAIENKIKSTEGRQQLGRYDQELANCPGVRKLYLTLTGDAPTSGVGWVPVSYTGLLSAIRAQSSGDPHVVDLCSALARLTALADAARDETGVVAEAAFEDREVAREENLESYMKKMRLEKVVQRVWMKGIEEGLDVPAPWQTFIAETQGQALLNVQASAVACPALIIGLQLQRRTLKAFSQPCDYSKVASAEIHRTVETTLKDMKAALALGENTRMSTTGLRGFRSFSLERKMPAGRNRHEWLAAVKPWLTTLVSAFPAVRTVGGK
jgi:hypothetical protein